MSDDSCLRPFLFLGDSLTAFGSWSALLPEAQLPINRGIQGNTARDIVQRLQALLPLEPRAMVLMVGTNDLIQARAIPDILADVRFIVQRFLAHASRVTLLAVLPVREADDPVFEGFNARAKLYNRELSELAAELGVPFIDFRAPFCDAEGELRAELTDDGVHLLPEGYALWAEALRGQVDLR